MGTGQPNILLVMADQLTAFALPCYGHSVVRAPHIARLAAGGVLFENAYCDSPLCAPSRASFMAGRCRPASRAYDNAAEFAADIPTYRPSSAPSRATAPCSPARCISVGPDQLHGFEERLTTDIYPADFGWTPDWDAPAGAAELVSQHEFGDAGRPRRAHQPARFRRRGHSSPPSAEIYDQARGDRQTPASASSLSLTHPHDPYAIRAEYLDRYRDDEIDTARRGADRRRAHGPALPSGCAMSRPWTIAAITPEDRSAPRAAPITARSPMSTTQVGELSRTLEDCGLADDTIVIFTADHGDMLGERGLWYKMCFFECSVRVPLIVTGLRPACAAAGGRRASLLDVLPTLLDLAGSSCAPRPSTPTAASAGAPRAATRPTEHRPNISPKARIAPIFMIRRGPHKFIWSEPDPPLLFDLERDPDELEKFCRFARACPDGARLRGGCA